MALRFRRTLTLFPGLRINLGKKGASLSVGAPGASLNIGKNGAYSNVGIPGTGLSMRTKIGGGKSEPRETAQASTPQSQKGLKRVAGVLVALVVWIVGGVSALPLFPKALGPWVLLAWTALVIYSFVLWRRAERAKNDTSLQQDPE